MTQPALERVPWFEAEPSVYQRELTAMAAVAPDLVWDDDTDAGGWKGLAPIWPFERPEPNGLKPFLDGARFTIAVLYRQSHPMVTPGVFPVDPQPERINWTLHAWHLNGDGSLCLLRSADDWDPRSTASELVTKASGWFLEFLLLTRGLRDEMTENGIAADASLDYLFT